VFERVPTNTVFADVAGKKVTASSLKQSLELFKGGKTKMVGQAKKTKLELISISDNVWKETKPGYVRVGAGPKAAAGLEDAGIFAGSKGRGNVMFSGIPGTASYEGFTLNPFSNIGKRPTANKIWVDSVARQKRSLVKRPGFKDPFRAEFFDKNIKGTGFSLISKRSEIGQGAVNRQMFNVLEDVKLRTVSYKKGQRVREAGTSEIETMLGKGEVLKRKKKSDDLLLHRIAGFRYYTRYGAKRIPFTQVEIPLTGEFVRVQEYNLMKWRAAKGTAGKGDIWKEKKVKAKIFEEVLKKPTSSRSVSKSKLYYPLGSPSSSSRSSRSSGVSSVLSSLMSSRSSRSSKPSTKSSKSSSVSSSISSLISGSRSRSKSSTSLSSRSFSFSKSTSKSSSRSSLTSQSSTKQARIRFGGLKFQRPRVTGLRGFYGFRNFKVDTKKVFGFEVN
jgi:hypothetical protein